MDLLEFPMRTTTTTSAARTALALLTITATAAPARADDWSALRKSGKRTTAEISGTTFSPSWTYAVRNGGHVLATPVSVDGIAVATGTNGDVAALGLQDGGERWTRVLDSGIGSTPAVTRGRVIVSTLEGQLYSLQLQTGAVNWQQPFGGISNYSSPVIIDEGPGSCGSIVLPAGFPSQDVSRIDLLTGKTDWRTAKGAIADLMYASPAIAGQQAVVGMNGGRYQSLDLTTGGTLWKIDTNGPVGFSSPMLAGDNVYMFPGNASSQLYAVNATTGVPVAGFPVSIPDLTPVAGDGMFGQGPVSSSPMMAGGLVIVQVRRGDMLKNPDGKSFRVAMRESVVAIDPALAKVVWQYQLATLTVPNVNGVPELDTCATPAGFTKVDGAAVVVSSSISPRVVILDAATGVEQWSAALSGPGRAAPIFSNGQLLVGTDAGVVHAFSSDTNTAPGVPAAPAMTGDTTTGSVALAWAAATDAEGQPLSYRVRVIEQGNETTNELDTTPGQTTLAVNVKANTTYHVSVRSRDSMGALSAWSETRSIAVGAVTGGTSVGMGDMPPGGPMGPPPALAPSSALALPATGAVPGAADSPTTAAPAAHEDVTDTAGGCSVGGAGSSGVATMAALAMMLAAFVTRSRRTALRTRAARR
jgi:outer membrane protein assembly factor BamB